MDTDADSMMNQIIKNVYDKVKPKAPPKPKVFTSNPFDYNYVALTKSKVDELPVPSTETVKSNQLYYSIGKSLGIENPHDWDKLYDKVFVISEWAREKTGSNDPEAVLAWITKVSKDMPSMGSKRITDLYNRIRISIVKGKNER